MMGGATRGRGGRALGRHLADLRPAASRHNESVRLGASRGLMTDGIVGQIDELTALVSHARTKQPLYHVHADPPADVTWSEAQWTRFWELHEREFGLEAQEFSESVHASPDGREHRHRVYSRIRGNGTAIRLDHDFARREKINRIVEFDSGELLQTGAHNRAVIAALIRDGRQDVADAMLARGKADAPKPVAVSPRERARGQRTDVDPRVLDQQVLFAWSISDTGAALEAALAEVGLRLDLDGDVPRVADAGGNLHGLRRILARASRQAGREPPIREAHVRVRLADIFAAREALKENNDERVQRLGRKARRFEGSSRAWAAAVAAAEAGSGEGHPGDQGRHEPDRPQARPVDRDARGGRGPACAGRGSPGGAGDPGASARAATGAVGQGYDSRLRGDRAVAPADRRRLEILRCQRALAEIPADLTSLIAQARQSRREARIRPEDVAALAGQILAPDPGRLQRRHLTVAIWREIGLDEPDQATWTRRDAWTAAVLRRVYSTGWLPPAVARNIRRIQPAEDGSRVDIWLWTGARITDTCDRITLSGPVDAIAVEEIVAAVQRRAWRSVSLTGSLEFQRRAALALALLDPPIAVARSQLDPEDLAEVEAARASGLAEQAAEPVGIQVRA